MSGVSIDALPSWNQAEGIQGVGIYTWNSGSLVWQKQAPITSGGGGGAVTIADGANVSQGSLADAAYVSGSGTMVALLKGIFGKVTTTPVVTGTVSANAGTNLNTSLLALEAGHLATIDTSTAKIPSQGQALAAASMPVVLTAIQQTALTPPAAITGFALEAGHLATIDTSTAKIPSQGQALSAASMPVVLPATQITTLTPPAAIVGFALEAGHLATIDAKIPSLGQTTASASTPVALASDTLNTLDLATGARQDQVLQVLAALVAQILACDTNNVNINTMPAVNVATMPAVNVVASTPLPTTPALPPNAAQESGGNLDRLNAVLVDMQQMIARQGDVQQYLLQQMNQIAITSGAQPITYQ